MSATAELASSPPGGVTIVYLRKTPSCMIGEASDEQELGSKHPVKLPHCSKDPPPPVQHMYSCSLVPSDISLILPVTSAKPSKHVQP